MINVLARALLHPKDYVGIVRKSILTFTEQQPEGDNYHSFIFKPEKPLHWHAGQHGILFLPTSSNDKGWRPFSVASSTHEKLVHIGTMVPELHSEFKTKLQALTPGDTVQFRGPYGEFHATGAPQRIVGVAGGIGITPFRALAYEIAYGHLPNTTLHLIYGTRDSYPFQSELDTWAAQSDTFSIEYHKAPEDIQAAISTQWNLYGADADYYLSGSPGMITGISTFCRSLGVTRIVNDPFIGY